LAASSRGGDNWLRHPERATRPRDPLALPGTFGSEPLREAKQIPRSLRFLGMTRGDAALLRDDAWRSGRHASEVASDDGDQASCGNEQQLCGDRPEEATADKSHHGTSELGIRHSSLDNVIGMDGKPRVDEDEE
jgi:hypothetical protein